MLTVTQAFSHYAIGDTITDAKTIADVLAGEHAAHVVRTAKPRVVKE